jgi:hypothetical protein
MTNNIALSSTIQEFYYHLCPILLDNQSKILPGNWYRNLTYYIQHHGSINTSNYIAYYKEAVLEQIRCKFYEQKASRIKSCFVFKDEIIARYYRDSFFPKDVMYKVRPEKTDCKMHVGNYNDIFLPTNLINMQNLQDPILLMQDIAHKYWQGQNRQSHLLGKYKGIDIFANQCVEVLFECGIIVIDMIK